MEVKIGGREYYRKRYIKDHPEYLFIFEDTLEDEDFEDYKNVFPIPTYDERGNYFKDKHLERNKSIIKDAIQDILKEAKRKSFRRVVIPEKSIGKGKSKLYEDEPETYEYIKRKMSELTTELKRSKYSSRDTYSSRNRYRSRDRYGKMMYRDKYGRSHFGLDHFGKKDYRRDRFRSRRRYDNNSNSNNNRRYGRRDRSRRRTKKELRKLRRQKKTRKINIDTVPKASKYGQKRCNACIRLKSLLKRPLTEKRRKGDKFVKELEKAEKKCLECNEICKFLDRNLKLGLEDFDIYKARYPSICLVDEKGSKRVFRLMNSYRKKLLEQMEHFDLNLEKE